MLAIHQPNYWPYPGLLGKIMRCDRFLFLTRVQFDKSSWQNRNRIRVKEGWKYVTVPVDSKGKEFQRINDVKIDNRTNWRNSHLNAIRFSYAKAPYFKDYFPFIEQLYKKKWDKLVDLDIYIMKFLLEELKSETELLIDTDYDFRGEKNELLIDICQTLGESKYMSNKGSENYIDIELFNENAIDHIYINYIGTEYRQQYDGYESGLSVLDMLMNCGAEKTRKMIMDDKNYIFSDWNKKII